MYPSRDIQAARHIRQRWAARSLALGTASLVVGAYALRLQPVFYLAFTLIGDVPLANLVAMAITCFEVHQTLRLARKLSPGRCFNGDYNISGMPGIQQCPECGDDLSRPCQLEVA